MALSDSLISQFAKLSKPEDKTKKESTVYGTVTIRDNKTYVILDGSNIPTPVTTTANASEGDRVVVLIKNHTATVTGNLTHPSAKNTDLQAVDSTVTDMGNTLTGFESALGNKVDKETYNKAISEFEIVIAGKVDTTEFNAQVGRIDTLASDNVTVKKNLSAAEADIVNLKAKDVTVEGRLDATEAAIEQLEAGSIDVESLKSTFATIENLNVVEQNVESLTGDLGEFKQLTAENFTAVDGEIENLDVKKLDVKTANATYAKIADLNAATANITDLNADFASFRITTTEQLTANNASIEELEVNKLSAEDIEGKYANIDFSNISKATMQWFYANSGLIQDVVVGDATISGKLVGVTISGDLVEAGTLVADKLVIQGEDGLYYKLNTDGMSVEASQTDYNSLNGSVIKAKSITASKISVTDLVAFGATIGGFHITNNSIYSGVKESVDNSTNGIYMDNIGQLALGDASRFIKYYKNTDGNYVLSIVADSINLGSEHTDVAVMLAEVAEESRTNTADLTAYMSSTNAELVNLQEQVDGSIATWFYEYPPTNDNIPASEWTTIDTKNKHLGDLFYDTITGYCYRWQVKNNQYSWHRLTDVDVTKALADAHAAQLTADGKRRVFVTTPVPPYDVGDLWTQGSGGDLMRCQTAKTESQSYASADWVKATKYTDDTAANAAQNGVNALGVRMTSAETSISENSEAIALRATKTEVTQTLQGYYTKDQADSNLTVKANEITSSVSNTYATKTALAATDTKASNAQTAAANAQADINGLEIGGRNMLVKSGEIYPSENVTNAYGFWFMAHATYAHGIVLEPNQNYVLSFDWTVDWGTCEHYTASVGIGVSRTPGSYSADIIHSTRIPNCDANNTSGRFSIVFNSSANGADLNEFPYFAMRPVRCGSPDQLDGSTWTVTKLKLEKGNKATDWSPAPEDAEAGIAAAQEAADNAQADVNAVVTRVTEAETSIRENAEAIELRATKTEMATAKSEAISTASSDATTKANNALNNANANTTNLLKSYSTTSEMNAAINMKADSITSTVSETYATKSSLKTVSDNVTTAQGTANEAKAEITGLKIGGRNLLKGTSDEFQTLTMGAETYYRQFSSDVELEAGQTYTFSVYVEKVSEDDVAINLHIGVGVAGNYNYDLSYWRQDGIPLGTRVSLTYTVRDTDIENYKYFSWRLRNERRETTIRFKEAKLEKGNKATDWTPAHEDMPTVEDVAVAQETADDAQALAGSNEERVSISESLIKQLSDSIATLVTDGNGESLMVQTENGWTFSTGQLQDKVNNTSQQLDDLIKEFGDVDTAVQVLQQSVDDLGVLSDYVKITTYESEPCIELGEMDSDFKLRITNTRILFMEGSNVPAYISNQALHINKALVEEELQQGGFVWKVRSNGNLGLVWKGVSG